MNKVIYLPANMPTYMRFACQFPGCNAVVYMQDIKDLKNTTNDCVFTWSDKLKYNPFQCFFKSTLYGMVLHAHA